MQQGIRKIEQQDITALKEVLDASELFPSAYLDDMIADYFNNPSSEDIWFTYVDQGKPISIAFCAPEKFTEGTFNLYAIAVRKEEQGKGVGKKMMHYIEELLKADGHRILIVETSGSEELALTRKFYEHCNYTQEATIREFWGAGEDKIVFWKKLIG